METKPWVQTLRLLLQAHPPSSLLSGHCYTLGSFTFLLHILQPQAWRHQLRYKRGIQHSPAFRALCKAPKVLLAFLVSLFFITSHKKSPSALAWEENPFMYLTLRTFFMYGQSLALKWIIRPQKLLHDCTVMYGCRAVVPWFPCEDCGNYLCTTRKQKSKQKLKQTETHFSSLVTSKYLEDRLSKYH